MYTVVKLEVPCVCEKCQPANYNQQVVRLNMSNELVFVKCVACDTDIMYRHIITSSKKFYENEKERV